MGLPIIFGLVALLAAFGVYSAIRNKNTLGLLFGLGTMVVFGWFSVMTVLNHGYPTVH